MNEFMFSNSEELKIALSKKMNEMTKEIYNFRHYMDKETYEKFMTFYDSYIGSALSALEYEAGYVKDFINDPYVPVNETFEHAKNLCQKICHFSLRDDND